MGIGVSLFIGFLAIKLVRFKFGPSSVLFERIDRLERSLDVMRSEKEQLQNELSHAKLDATSKDIRIGELNGRCADQRETIAELTGEFERIKDDMSKLEQENQVISRRYRKTMRQSFKLNEKLQDAKVTNGRIWEMPMPHDASPFRPLSQRRTPILSLLNLKGGVGKTTIAANLAVAMGQQTWRVLLVDLDHQGSLSQLLLTASEFDDVLASRRLVHDALGDPANGLARFRAAMFRLTTVGPGEVFLVGADEELGDLETALSQRWTLKLTPDDIRYRLRTILHAKEIADRFDVIVLDCPPRLTTACINALAASDYVLIPVLPNAISTAAAPRLLRWLHHLRQIACPELSVMGVVGNKAKFYGNTAVKKQQQELDSLADICRDSGGEGIKFFPPLRIHDPLVHPLPALDPKLLASFRGRPRRVHSTRSARRSSAERRRTRARSSDVRFLRDHRRNRPTLNRRDPRPWPSDQTAEVAHGKSVAVLRRDCRQRGDDRGRVARVDGAEEAAGQGARAQRYRPRDARPSTIHRAVG